MKLTFSTLASPAWTLDQIIQHAGASGISGIDFRGIGPELDITQLPAFTTDLQSTLAKLREHHLEMPCLNSSITLVTAMATKWDTMLAEARRYADLAEKTRTGFLRVFGGSIPPGMSREDARDLARKHLQQLIDICKPCGCKPLLETHDAWTVSSAVLEILGDFPPEQAGVLWDLEHPWRGGESPADTATQLTARIQHVHIKDTIRKEGKSKPVLLGDGELPLKECFDALEKINYTGWICLETEKRWHAEGPEPEVSVPQFAAYMRRVGDSD
jgi:sugar phosphate isomerase/epimerase